VKAQPQSFFTSEALSASRISYPAIVNEEASEIIGESHAIHLDLRNHHNEPQLETLVQEQQISVYLYLTQTRYAYFTINKLFQINSSPYEIPRPVAYQSSRNHVS
jgi:hypothetical protein